MSLSPNPACGGTLHPQCRKSSPSTMHTAESFRGVCAPTHILLAPQFALPFHQLLFMKLTAFQEADVALFQFRSKCRTLYGASIVSHEALYSWL